MGYKISKYESSTRVIPMDPNQISISRTRNKNKQIPTNPNQVSGSRTSLKMRSIYVRRGRGSGGVQEHVIGDGLVFKEGNEEHV